MGVVSRSLRVFFRRLKEATAQSSVWHTSLANTSGQDRRTAHFAYSSSGLSGAPSWGAKAGLSEETLRRPEGLNTVTRLKVASAALGRGAQHTMRVAESLYMDGYISYPRTESTAYPPGFDFATTLRDQVEHPEWGVHAAWLLDGNMVRPRGVDAGDHPPITPVRAATMPWTPEPAHRSRTRRRSPRGAGSASTSPVKPTHMSMRRRMKLSPRTAAFSRPRLPHSRQPLTFCLFVF